MLRKLEQIRRRIPYAYWLFYDCVFLALMIYGITHFSAWFWAGLPFLAISTFFDVVEFIVKATEDRWEKRLFEGTGAPTHKPGSWHGGIHYHGEPAPTRPPKIP